MPKTPLRKLLDQATSYLGACQMTIRNGSEIQHVVYQCANDDEQTSLLATAQQSGWQLCETRKHNEKPAYLIQFKEPIQVKAHRLGHVLLTLPADNTSVTQKNGCIELVCTNPTYKEPDEPKSKAFRITYVPPAEGRREAA